MTRAWTAWLGPGGAAMDAVSAAVGDGGIHVGATPNLLFRLDQRTGAIRWVANTGVDVFAYQPVTLANGVLYVIGDAGDLRVFDAASGVPVVQRSIAIDGGLDQCIGAGAGVAVARHTVFVPCDAGGPNDLAGLPSSAGGLVAYRVAPT
jgi:outer membrane protein assembly factor BamB